MVSLSGAEKKNYAANVVTGGAAFWGLEVMSFEMHATYGIIVFRLHPCTWRSEVMISCKSMVKAH